MKKVKKHFFFCWEKIVFLVCQFEKCVFDVRRLFLGLVLVLMGRESPSTNHQAKNLLKAINLGVIQI